MQVTQVMFSTFENEHYYSGKKTSMQQCNEKLQKKIVCTPGMYNLMSVRLYNFKDGESKKLDYCPRIKVNKKELRTCINKKCQNRTFKVNFLCQKSTADCFYI